MNSFEQTVRRLEASLAPLLGLEFLPNARPQAAVSLLLRDNEGEAEVLIIKRSERVGDPWSGHLALPGGRAEAVDRDLTATAARETMEEIGLDLATEGRFLGRLPMIDTNHPRLPDLEITPFVVVAGVNADPQLSREVAALYWVSMNRLLMEGPSQEFKYSLDGVLYQRPAYQSEGGLIWGITERILTSLLSHLK